MPVRSLFRLAAPLVALVLFVACTDTADPNSGLPTLTEPGFYPLLSTLPSASAGSTVTLSLKQVPGGIELASVQGEITYDAALLKLDGATLPAGVEGDAEEVSPGRVRFVATLLPGATEPPLLQLQLSGRDGRVSMAREMFKVSIEEVTGGADLADLTTTVRADQLLFVRSR
jgi:hypothetical protein